MSEMDLPLDVRMMQDGYLMEIDALQAENAKLRELLLEVWNAATQFDEFWDYVHDDGEIYNEDELPHFLERMSDLGIEVE